MAPNKSRLSICATKVSLVAANTCGSPARDVGASHGARVDAPRLAATRAPRGSSSRRRSPQAMRREAGSFAGARDTPSTRSAADSSSMRTLARSTYLRRRCADRADEFARQHGQEFLGRGAHHGEQRDDAALRVVQTGERARAHCELLDVRRKLSLQKPRRIGAAKREHAERRRLRERSTSPDMLIFVFARISCGLKRAILAEFAPVPNAPSDVESARQSRRRRHAKPPPASRRRESPWPQPPEQCGGPTGPEPTRFGDWERNGRCIDF